jgi:hypothetical protein
MTGGDITAVKKHDQSIQLVVEAEGEKCVLNISPTNYKLSIGDYISWNKKNAYWRSQHRPETEVTLFKISVVLNSK